MIWLLNLPLHMLPRSPYLYERRDLRRIQCARRIDKSAPGDTHAIFDAAEITDRYFIHRRTSSYPETLPQWPQFTQWAIENRPAWIATDPQLAQQYGVTPVQLDQFLQTDLGYTQHPCPAETAGFTIYTRNPPRLN
jgi:hypothetical protein